MFHSLRVELWHHFLHVKDKKIACEAVALLISNWCRGTRYNQMKN